MSAHAVLSPSGAHRWLTCPGSVALTKGMPDTSSAAADDGTVTHFLAEHALKKGVGFKSANYTGRVVRMTVSPDGRREMAFLPDWDRTPTPVGGTDRVIDVDRMSRVKTYFDSVLEHAGVLGTIDAEVKVPIERYTLEQRACGTADAIVVRDGELQIHDLKDGHGLVNVENNEQLMLYALGAYDVYSLLVPIDRIKLVIHQPRHGPAKEGTCTTNNLNAFGEEVKAKAKAIWDGDKDKTFVPGDNQCKWCRGKVQCPALADLAQNVVNDFDDLDAIKHDPQQLADKYTQCGVLEMWIKAIKQTVYEELHKGSTVPGYKLVQGRRGARAWVDEAEAERFLKTMRVPHEDLYTHKLMSPTKTEKRFGPNGTHESTTRWRKLNTLITQPEGKQTVVSEDDPRGRVPPTIDDFSDISGE